MLESIAIAYSLHHHAHSSRHPAPDAGSQSTNVGKKTGFFARTSHVQNDATANIGQPDKAVSPPQNDAPEKKAFTLAEVLITLGIIGVVAAMTLPSIIQRNNEREAVSRLKKAYSTILQAYIMAESELGSPDNWDLKGYASRDGALNLIKILTPYIKTIKICDRKRDCFPDVIYKSLNPKVLAQGETYNQYIAAAEAKLADGMLIRTFIWNNDCKTVLGTTKELKNVCAIIGVDINGFKGPNQYGWDYFEFNITKYGVIPNGVPEMTAPNSFENSCKDKDRGENHWSANGGGCAAWVIYNGNMDYLHCKDLSWDGKRKCSQ